MVRWVREVALRLKHVAAAVAGLGAVVTGAGSAVAQDIVFDQYSVVRISPAARYYTPGSLIMGWYYKGLLRVEMVCRNKVDLENDDAVLKAKVESAGSFNQKGWTFNVSGNVTETLNAEFGGNYVNAVTMSISDVTIYEYSAEDLRAIREALRKRESCAAELKNPRFRELENYNGKRAGIFQNTRFAIGNVTYTVEFNKDNPKALSAGIQGQVTKKLQAKFGLTYLNASQSQLKGEGVVIGLSPLWRSQWN